MDALRGIAALAVALGHVSDATRQYAGLAESWLTDLLAYGGQGVDVFFVISGFVIAYSTAGGRHSAPYFFRFVARRITRLDIPYWLAIAAEIGAIWLVGLVMASKARPIPDPQDILINAMYLQLFLGAPEVLIVAWSLCYEVQFYLVFVGMLCAYAGVRRLTGQSIPRIGGIAVLLLSFALSATIFAGHLGTPPIGLFIDRWFEFALGIMTYLYFSRQLGAAVVTSACAFTLGCFAVGDPHMIRLKVAVACVLTVITICLARDVDGWRQAITRRTLLFLGRISYSFYLLHATVGWRVAAVLGIGATQAGMPVWAAATVSFTGSLAASILVAWITYRLVERPSISLSHMISLPTLIDDPRPGRRPQPVAAEPS